MQTICSPMGATDQTCLLRHLRSHLYRSRQYGLHECIAPCGCRGQCVYIIRVRLLTFMAVVIDYRWLTLMPGVLQQPQDCTNLGFCNRTNGRGYKNGCLLPLLFLSSFQDPLAFYLQVATCSPLHADWLWAAKDGLLPGYSSPRL